MKREKWFIRPAAVALLVALGVSAGPAIEANRQEPKAELRLSLQVEPYRDDAEYALAFANVGEVDTVLNLGIMLANGRRQLPSAIQLVFTDSTGNDAQAEFAMPPIGGRVDDYLIPLRAGSQYSVRLAASSFHRVTFDAESVRARFVGKEAGSANPDVEGLKFLPFWIGTIESNVVNFKQRALNTRDKKDLSPLLEAIVAKVKSVLPDGWSVAIALTEGTSEVAPMIAIRTTEAVDVIHAIPGAPNPDAAIVTSKDVVSIEYVLRKSMTPTEHKIAMTRNQSHTDLRTKFQREKLKHLSYAHKGSAPIPPGKFRATTTASETLLTEYACLWVNTPVDPLPTHHANALSFERVAPSTQIKDRRIEVELKEIEKQLNKIFAPYE